MPPHAYMLFLYNFSNVADFFSEMGHLADCSVKSPEVLRSLVRGLYAFRKATDNGHVAVTYTAIPGHDQEGAELLVADGINGLRREFTNKTTGEFAYTDELRIPIWDETPETMFMAHNYFTNRDLVIGDFVADVRHLTKLDCPFTTKLVFEGWDGGGFDENSAEHYYIDRMLSEAIYHWADIHGAAKLNLQEYIGALVAIVRNALVGYFKGVVSNGIVYADSTRTVNGMLKLSPLPDSDPKDWGVSLQDLVGANGRATVDDIGVFDGKRILRITTLTTS